MRRRAGHALITGGAGFIGANLADRLVREGERVLLLDNLSRPGVERNLAWLEAAHRGLVEVERADVRDARAVARAVREASSVFHLAAQVAVTTSLENPLADFEVNARGTLNVLEAVRARRERPPFVFTSTNKVYGALDDLELCAGAARYEPSPASPFARGVSEARPVEFHSPYGCSKGAADQYVLDWARTFDVPALVFRMSCIYGPHQHGNEDQGWVAHVVRAALRGEVVTIYGDGRQVRDLLFVEDLLDAFLLARADARRLAGEAYNVGGGPGNTLSLLQLVHMLEVLEGERPRIAFSDWRAADQRWYVSDTRKLHNAVGWAPKVAVGEGIRRLHAWLRAAAPGPVGRALTEAQP
jgi:CDP-paratose 2-epimerase